MEVAAFIAAGLLSAVFTIAAVAKLRDPGAFLMALPELGLSDRLGSVLARLLPIIEVGLAVALWVPAVRVGAALGAMGLLAAFTAVLLPSVVRGRAVRCACFGSLGTDTVSVWSIVRNGALLAAGLLVAIHPAGWGDAVLDAGGVTSLLLVGAVVVLSGIVVRLGRAQLDLLGSYGEVLLRVEALESATSATPNASGAGSDRLLAVGSAAPEVALDELGGDTVSLASLRGAGTAVLVFSNPSCQSCRELLEPLAAWSERHPDTTVAVLSPVSPRRARDQHRGRPIRWFVDRDRVAFDAFGATHTPTLVVVGADATVLHVARGASEAVEVLDRLDLERTPLDQVEVLTPEGRRTAFGEVAEDRDALLFWNDGCGHCAALRPTLDARSDELSALRVTVVLNGQPKPLPGTLPGGFAGVVFDPHGRLTRKLAVPGTPTLVPLGDDWRGGEPAVGGPEVTKALDALLERLAVPTGGTPR